MCLVFYKLAWTNEISYQIFTALCLNVETPCNIGRRYPEDGGHETSEASSQWYTPLKYWRFCREWNNGSCFSLQRSLCVKDNSECRTGVPIVSTPCFFRLSAELFIKECPVNRCNLECFVIAIWLHNWVLFWRCISDWYRLLRTSVICWPWTSKGG